MQIVRMLAPLGSACRSGNKLLSFVGVTIHNTGNTKPRADAIAHGKLLQGNGASKKASWHYCVDEKGAVQSVPEDEQCYHAGDDKFVNGKWIKGTGNGCTIAIEICINIDGDIEKATDNAVELCIDIFKRKGIKDATKYLFQHNHWSGKDCPQMIRDNIPYSWETFVSKVNMGLSDNPLANEVQKKYKFDTNTMLYLSSYKYADNLFELILKEDINEQYFALVTIDYILQYKYGKEVFERIISGGK